jgi:hypothetical protein
MTTLLTMQRYVIFSFSPFFIRKSLIAVATPAIPSREGPCQNVDAFMQSLYIDATRRRQCVL